MNDIEVGQVLSFKCRYNNAGDIAKIKHPYLVVVVTDEYVEVAQVDSLEGKEYKAAFISNHTIFKDDPTEVVFDKDSYIQLDNTVRIENHAMLVNYRRQSDKLSQTKLSDALDAYHNYHKNYSIDENKQVYIDEVEFIAIN